MKKLEILHTKWTYAGDLFFNGEQVRYSLKNISGTVVKNRITWHTFIFKQTGVLQVKGHRAKLFHNDRQPIAMALFIKRQGLILEGKKIDLPTFAVYEFDCELEALQYIQKYNEINKQIH